MLCFKLISCDLQLSFIYSLLEANDELKSLNEKLEEENGLLAEAKEKIEDELMEVELNYELQADTIRELQEEVQSLKSGKPSSSSFPGADVSASADVSVAVPFSSGGAVCLSSGDVFSLPASSSAVDVSEASSAGVFSSAALSPLAAVSPPSAVSLLAAAPASPSSVSTSHSPEINVETSRSPKRKLSNEVDTRGSNKKVKNNMGTVPIPAATSSASRRSLLSYRSGMVAPPSVVPIAPKNKKPVNKKLTKLQRFVNSSKPSKVLERFSCKSALKAAAPKQTDQGKYLQLVDVSINTMKVPLVEDSSLTDVLEEVSECLQHIRSTSYIQLEDSVTTFGIQDFCQLTVPSRFDKREKAYAWLLTALGLSDTGKSQMILETLKYDCLKYIKSENMKENVFVRYIRIITTICKYHGDYQAMYDLFFDVLYRNNKPDIFLLAITNAVFIWRDFLQPYSSPRPTNGILAKAFITIGSHANKTRRASDTNKALYNKMMTTLNLPPVEEASSLRGFVDEVLDYLNTSAGDVYNDSAAGEVLCKALELPLLYLRNWEYTYDDVIRTKLLPMLKFQAKAALVIKLMGSLGRISIGRTAFEDDENGADSLVDFLFDFGASPIVQSDDYLKMTVIEAIKRLTNSSLKYQAMIAELQDQI
ncbi:hypothetical protein BDB01DRAFT_776771 [Pilobolus umbonatus]|nr:hypothetical protein BDB01DRAFT_776771 [Pilobolus umbonatus]